MNAAAWVGLGFVASSWNASVDQIKSWGCITAVAPQIAWGTGSPHASDDENLLNGCDRVGLRRAGWGWCDGKDVEGEARYHAQRARDLNLPLFIANMEEPYDAHGDSSSPRYQMGNRYAQAFREVNPSVEFAVTTTPRWASDGGGLRAAGAVIMPQCFTGEVTSGDAAISAAVPFMQSWGWTVDRIRPLVQTYMTNGVYPDPNVYNTEAFTYSVGVVPYTLEQGGAVIPTLAPSIERQPAAGPTPIPPPDGGEAPIPPEPVPAPPELTFVRALYPPSAAARGKTPSTPGPDVEAVKRAVSRAGGGGGSDNGWQETPPRGFWKWQSFDRQYSDSFAGGGASGSGMEGFQRAAVACEPTGWMGKQTFEALRTYLIPSGLSNAGQYAFDARACELYRQA